jgi:predicted nucleic acid-binding protein
VREGQALFDASSILALVRDLKGAAPLVLSEGSTLSLAFYEVGNAIWKECKLHERLTPQEGEDLLKTIFAIIRAMDMETLGGEDSAGQVLKLALRVNLTYYDACYLAKAKESRRILVSSDSKLLEAAKNAGVEALTPQTYERQIGCPSA